MFDLDLIPAITELVLERIPRLTRHSDRYQFNCPFCGDRKKRGWYYLKNGSFFCFNAGCPVNDGISTWKYLSMLTGETESQVKADLIRRSGGVAKAAAKTMSVDDLFEKSSSQEQAAPEGEEWTANLPETAREFIARRKLDKAPYLNGLKFMYDPKTMRLVIPWPEGYWQKRALAKSQEKDGKYLFPKDIPKPVFGIDRADFSGGSVYVLEGALDSVFVKGGVAAGGIQLSDRQAMLLEPLLKDHDLVAFMDNQYADKTSMEKTVRLLKEDPWRKVFIWPPQLAAYKDVNESVVACPRAQELWSSDKFLRSRVFHGAAGLLELARGQGQV